MAEVTTVRLGVEYLDVIHVLDELVVATADDVADVLGKNRGRTRQLLVDLWRFQWVARERDGREPFRYRMIAEECAECDGTGWLL